MKTYLVTLRCDHELIVTAPVPETAIRVGAEWFGLEHPADGNHSSHQPLAAFGDPVESCIEVDLTTGAVIAVLDR